ncbi:MAG: hypothetical protein WC449_00665 [Candidatus Paceibacterota bacterium]
MKMNTILVFVVGISVAIISGFVYGIIQNHAKEKVLASMEQRGATEEGVRLTKLVVEFHRDIKEITASSCLPGIRIYWFNQRWAWIAPNNNEFPQSLAQLNTSRFVNLEAHYPQKQLNDFALECHGIGGVAGKEFADKAEQVAKRVSEESVCYHIEKGTFE